MALLSVAFPFSGVPTPPPDGITTVFEIEFQPLPNSLSLYNNGHFQYPGLTADYTIIGNQITFNVAPASGDKLYAQGTH